jgi:hypothetical protein
MHMPDENEQQQEVGGGQEQGGAGEQGQQGGEQATELFQASEAAALVAEALDDYAAIVKRIKVEAAEGRTELIARNDAVTDQTIDKLRNGGFYVNRAKRGLEVSWANIGGDAEPEQQEQQQGGGQEGE